MIRYYIILIIMTILGSVASLFLKKTSDTGNIFLMLKNRNLYAGGGLYVTAALLNIYILKYLDYSLVLPLTSLTYIWTMLFSYIYLKEKITKKKIVGVFLILIGAVLISFV